MSSLEVVQNPAGWSPVTQQAKVDRGAAIKRRRLAHGIRSQRAFSERTGLSRDAVKAAESGLPSTTDATFDRLEAWLDEYDKQTSLDTASPSVPAPRHEVEDTDDLPRDMIEIDVIGPSTRWQVKLRGHSGDADLLRNQAEKLLRNVGSDED